MAVPLLVLRKGGTAINGDCYSFPLPWQGNKPKNKVPNRLVEDQHDP